LFSATFTVVTVNATSRPSGETSGAESVTTRYQSFGVNARPDCAASGAAATSERATNGA
jgi:hypothetical protein